MLVNTLVLNDVNARRLTAMIQWISDAHIERDMSLSRRGFFEVLYAKQIGFIYNIKEFRLEIMRNDLFKTDEHKKKSLEEIAGNVCFYTDGLRTIKEHISELKRGYTTRDISLYRDIAIQGLSGILENDLGIFDEKTIATIKDILPSIIVNLNLIHEIFDLYIVAENEFRLNMNIPLLKIPPLDPITPEIIKMV